MSGSTKKIMHGDELVADDNPLPVKPVGGETPGAAPTTVTTTQGVGYSASATQARPNDTNAYAAGDVVADSTSAPTVLTFANIGPAAGGKVLLTAAELEIDVASVPSGMTGFRLHLYSSSPTAINDNAAFDLPSGDRAKYLGFVELPTPVDLGATLWSETEAMNLPVRKLLTLASGSLYGILQTIGAFTPTAQASKTVKLHTVLV